MTSEIVVLEKEKERILIENAALLVGTQTLQGRVESLELDKNKMACEIEELNQWLQGPTAEKKQLAANLDEMAQLLKGLEVERDQLVTTVSELQQERERLQKDSKSLQDAIDVQEEEKANILLSHKDLSRHVQSLGEEKQQAMRVHEGFALVVRHLNEKIHVVEEEATRIVSERDDALLRLQGLEEGKTVLEKLLDEQSISLNELRTENKEHMDAAGRLEEMLAERLTEVQLLKDQVLIQEGECSDLKIVHETILNKLQVVETAKFEAEKSLEEVVALNSNLMEQLSSSEHKKERNIRLQEEVVSVSEEKRQVVQSLEVSRLLVQELHVKNSELSETINRLEEELVKEHDEFKSLSGRVSGLENEKEKYSSLLATCPVRTIGGRDA